MRINAAGILLSTVALDSDHHAVPLTYSVPAHERERAFRHTLQVHFSKDTYGDAYDRPERREISDQDKGLAAAWRKVMPNGSKAFNCARHRGDNVSTIVKPGGSEASKLWEKAAKALALARLAEIEATHSPQAAAYMSQVPDEAQYMAACGNLHGEWVNSTVEGMNAANDEVRKEFSSGVPMTGALLRLVKDSARRYTDNKRKALTATHHLPRAVLSRMDAVLAKAQTITSDVTFPGGATKHRSCGIHGTPMCWIHE
ncbi:hypothetical protein CYMTET_56126 [Cymbomonas tetramitiformis]|uniref:Uncharacterized protein n=1 Tax=Cymbomonas tetramitiformis TaxID=36881 RepID=A0AAE0EMW0_9CHLO|nr:hypothetical protein CYMTET_56126 [Cymbomonas tetramitiformis]